MSPAERRARQACTLLLEGRLAAAARALEYLGRIPPEGFWERGEWEKPRYADDQVLARRLTAAITRRPGPWLYFLRSLCWRGLLRYPEARWDMESAVKLAPGSPVLRAFLGRARLLAGESAGSEDLEAAASSRPSCGWLWAWLGEAQRLSGDPEGALERFEKAIALDPSYSRAEAWRGGTLRRLGRLAQARPALDRAITAEPDYAWARYERFALRRELDEIAWDDLEAAYRGDPRYGLVDFPVSREAADRALRLVGRPKGALAWAWRGKARLDAGDPEGAAADLDRAITLDSSLSRAWAWRGQARGSEGDLRRALELEPRNAEAQALLGRLLARERPSQAAALLRRAIARDPRFAWAWTELSGCLERLGRLEEAEKACARALALHPQDGVARRRRAELREALAGLRRRGPFELLLLEGGPTTAQACRRLYAARAAGFSAVALSGDLRLRADVAALRRFARRCGFSAS